MRKILCIIKHPIIKIRQLIGNYKHRKWWKSLSEEERQRITNESIRLLKKACKELDNFEVPINDRHFFVIPPELKKVWEK